jgi:hypothetical protein
MGFWFFAGFLYLSLISPEGNDLEIMMGGAQRPVCAFRSLKIRMRAARQNPLVICQFFCNTGYNTAFQYLVGRTLSKDMSDNFLFFIHRKKRFRGFPFPSRDVTYQTLSRREYVSLIKHEVFPFPSWNSHRIPLNQLVFLFTDRSFPRYSSSPGGNSSKIFDKSFVYLFPS